MERMELLEPPIDAFMWRAVFCINVRVSVGVLLLGRPGLSESRESNTGPLPKTSIGKYDKRVLRGLHPSGQLNVQLAGGVEESARANGP